MNKKKIKIKIQMNVINILIHQSERKIGNMGKHPYMSSSFSHYLNVTTIDTQKKESNFKTLYTPFKIAFTCVIAMVI